MAAGKPCDTADITAEVERHEAGARAKKEADEAYLRTPEGQAELARCRDVDYELYLAKNPDRPLSREEFDTFPPTRRTLRQFITACHDLDAQIRELMLPNPDLTGE